MRSLAARVKSCCGGGGGDGSDDEEREWTVGRNGVPNKAVGEK